jgi:hypothetical protein
MFRCQEASATHRRRLAYFEGHETLSESGFHIKTKQTPPAIQPGQTRAVMGFTKLRCFGRLQLNTQKSLCSVVFAVVRNRRPTTCVAPAAEQEIKVIDPANARLASPQADAFYVQWLKVPLTPSRRHH